MNKTYRNQHFHLYAAWFLLSIIAIVITIISLLGIGEINTIISVVSMFNTLLFLFYAKLNSVMLHKIVINNNSIEIFDYMPRHYIKIPFHQKIEIDQIKDVFWSEYDIKSSLKTSRMIFNKNSARYDYIISKNPRVVKFLVFRMQQGLNAYMRYFTCLSIDDQRKILNHLLHKNGKIKFRFGNGDLSYYKILQAPDTPWLF